MKKLKVPAIVLAIGLVLAVVACLLTNMIFAPAITEHTFRYSVTYKLVGEVKTLEGTYKCSYDGYNPGESPYDRYYSGEYTVNGETFYSQTHTIAQKDGAELYIVILFNDCYLMGDTKDMDYEPFLEDPSLEAVDREGYPYEEGQMPNEFTAEILSWEYPDPIENTLVFRGFSILHAGSMLAMLVAGLLTILACIIFVKRDKSVPYKVLDKVSIAFNIAISVMAIPFITIVTALFRITMTGEELIYQYFLCTPAFTAFTVAASIALRRKGFTKTGFFLQFVGPVLFFVPVVLEVMYYNLFF